jgi:ribosomal protein S18 acetylase RimI-like enzyme
LSGTWICLTRILICEKNKLEKLLHYDEWLSALLEKPVYHVSGNVLDINEEDIPDEHCFIDAKASVEDLSSVKHLEDLGFRLIDTNVQLIRKAQRINFSKIGTRFALESDENMVRQLAGSSFTQSRFHIDREISGKIANKIKSEWAANFFLKKRGEWMVVSEINGVLVGFLQLLKKDHSTIVIDLIAVSPSFQGKGIGKSMISFAIQNCTAVIPNVIVGTQIANMNSLKTYNNLGFRTTSAQYVFHMHK